MSVKLCGDRIIFSLKQTRFIGKLNINCIRSSLFTFQRQNINHSIINSLHTNSYNNYTHHILSFCTQAKKHNDENELENELEDESEDIANNESESNENDNGYEEEYETEEEESEYEYEYEEEYETDEEFEEDNSSDSAAPMENETQKQTEISENFDFNAYSEKVMNELFMGLPETGRIEGKQVEHFISALILKPLEVLEDEIHNKFLLMHNDMDKLMANAYKIPIENESDLRDIIDLSYDKLNIYSAYIENNFDLRHSPKHYLLRQLRIDHGKIVFLSIRKIMYYKYPKWVENDNWANDEMTQPNLRKFIISNELGIGIENLKNDNDDIIDDIIDDNDNEQSLESDNIEVETDQHIIETDQQQKES
eukprot:287125_1